MREEFRTLGFAAVICIVCSLLLSVTAAGLKNRIATNEAYDAKRNIIKALGVTISSLERSAIETLYRQHVTESTTNEKPIYTWRESGSARPTRYAFPISGKGLWGMIYGYISVEADFETVAGISFYKHNETPGLGAEIDQPKFQSQFKGKKLYHGGVPTAFRVTKPGHATGASEVDGLAGATLTSKGVEALLRWQATAYAETLNTIREEQNHDL